MAPNLLEIPLILENIFSKLEIEDQKNFRLVSHYWRDVTLCYWRCNAVVRIRNLAKLIDFIELADNTPGKKREENVLLKWNQIPFRRFRLSGMFIQLPFVNPNLIDACYRNERYLWDRMVSKMTHLELKDFTVTGPREFNIVKWILKKANKDLKELVIEGITYVDFFQESTEEEEGAAIPEREKLQTVHVIEVDAQAVMERNHAKEVLKLIPNVKSLKVDHGSITLLHELQQRHNKVEEIRLHYPARQFLQSNPVFSSLLNYMELAKPPLKSFEIVGLEGVVNNSLPVGQLMKIYDNPVGQFMKNYGINLKKLNLEFKQITGGQGTYLYKGLNCLHFQELTHLSFKFCDCSPSGYTSFDFQLLKQTPNLKVLHCLSDVDTRGYGGPLMIEWLTEARREVGPEGGIIVSRHDQVINLENLEEFHYSRKYKLNVACLKRFSLWMKNLKVLKIMVDKEVYPEVFKAWPKLELLVVLPGSQVRRSRRWDQKKSRLVRNTRVVFME